MNGMVFLRPKLRGTEFLLWKLKGMKISEGYEIFRENLRGMKIRDVV